uniref:ARAD1C36146p n=1 Tax=Blastobotrys adeninivorans TaxID=409370 RepID=A0A060T2W5_BLAAD
MAPQPPQPVNAARKKFRQFKDMFDRDSRNGHNQGPQFPLKEATSLSNIPDLRPRPLLTIVEGIESPFMSIDYPSRGAVVDAHSRSKAKPDINTEASPSSTSNNTINLFPSLWDDPYSSLKIEDEMQKFYDSSARNTTNTASMDFKWRVEIVKMKHKTALDQLQGDCKEFNFLFRDFIGHLNVLVDATSGKSWCIEFLVPFLNPGNIQGNAQAAHCHQAFCEVIAVIRRLAKFQSQDFKLARQLLSIVWNELEELIRLNAHNSDIAFEGLYTIVSEAPLTLDLVYKMIVMRTIYSNFYDDSQKEVRGMRAKLLSLIIHRLKHEIRDGSSSRLLDACGKEVELSLSLETLQEIKDILTTSLNLASNSTHEPIPFVQIHVNSSPFKANEPQLHADPVKAGHQSPESIESESVEPKSESKPNAGSDPAPGPAFKWTLNQHRAQTPGRSRILPEMAQIQRRWQNATNSNLNAPNPTAKDGPRWVPRFFPSEFSFHHCPTTSANL